MSVTYEDKLGRLHRTDTRDHPLQAHLTTMDTVELHSIRHASFFRKYFQDGGTCVGHGVKAAMLTAPMIQTKRDGPPSPYDLYDYAIKVDEWTENDNDWQRQMGTSVRAGFKAAQYYGYVAGYGFVWNIDDFLRGMMIQPLVLGTNWYDTPTMWQCDDKTGLMSIPTGARVAGGHCYLCDQIDMVRGLAFGPNSWGYTFGRRNKDGTRNGRWGMPLEMVERLLSEDGEAGTYIEIRKAA